MKAKQKITQVGRRLTENTLSEGKKILLVFLSAYGTAALNKGLDKLMEDHPDIGSWLKYLRPLGEIVTGLGIAAASTPAKGEGKGEEESILKYIGYGVAIGGGIDGIRLIPYVGDVYQLNGLGELPANTVYYTEPEMNKLELGNFGLAALPVTTVEMQAAPQYDVDLPDLEGYGTYKKPAEKNKDFGYNGEMTRDTDDLSGLI